jgi:hypothetical protein
MISEELLWLIDRAADEGWKELDLLGMGLLELPKEIETLPELESLMLEKSDCDKEIWVGNQFTEFPEAIFHLMQLRCLSGAENSQNPYR